MDDPERSLLRGGGIFPFCAVDRCAAAVFNPAHATRFPLPAARQALEQSLEIARASSAQVFVFRSTALLAAVEIQEGSLEHAQSLLDGIIPEWQAEQSVFVRQAWRVRVELALAQGHPSEALRIVDRLIDNAENGPARGENAVPALARLRGEALAAMIPWVENAEQHAAAASAEAELRAAVALARSHNRFPLLWRAQASLGHFYLLRQQPEQAQAAFDGAREMIAQLAGRVPEHLQTNFLEHALAQLPGGSPGPKPAAKPERPGGLTSRELEVAALIAQGKSNREIAEALVVGVRTVEAHITRILTKLNFNSRTEIAVWAAGKGLKH